MLAEHVTSRVTSAEEHEHAIKAAATLTGGDQLARRSIMTTWISRITVGEGELTIATHDGQRLRKAITRLRDGRDVRLVVGEQQAGRENKGDAQIIALLQDARRAQELALAKPKLSLAELAIRFGRSPDRFKRLLRLSYLSPTIVIALLQGSAPDDLHAARLRQLDRLPLAWAEQEGLLLS
jgi:hypothetical protein